MKIHSLSLAAALLLGVSVTAQADDWYGQPGGDCTTCGGSIANGLHAHGRNIKRNYNEWVAGRKLVYYYNLPDKNG